MSCLDTEELDKAAMYAKAGTKSMCLQCWHTGKERSCD